MKNLKIAAFSILSSTLLLTSCSSSSCYNPCNWRPFWKKPCRPVCYQEPVCHQEPVCCPVEEPCPPKPCAYAPYPDTSVEDAPTPRYLREEPIDSRDVPYYEDTFPDHQAPSATPAPAQPSKQPVESAPKTPSQPAPVKENLDKVKEEHQKVLSRYKKAQPQDDPITSEDTEYFDRIVQKVMSKDRQSN